MTEFYYANIERDTKDNKFYRRVMYTDRYLQVVYMSLAPGVEIGREKHAGTQFFRVESGIGSAIVDDEKLTLKDGIALTVPPHTFHNIRNTSKTEPLKLYTIYSPPQHPSYTVELTKE